MSQVFFTNFENSLSQIDGYADSDLQDLQLSEHLTSFLLSLKTDFDVSPVPSRFHRQWIRTSVNGHIKHLRKSILFLKKGSYDKGLYEYRTSRLWFNQAKNIFETTVFIRNVLENDSALIYRQNHKEIKEGDVILSYKTVEYLRRSSLSWLVKFATHSSITHALIACKDSTGKMRFLVSGDKTDGLGFVSPFPDSEEILIVMRPNQNSRRKILRSMASWKETAITRNNEMSQKDNYMFPEFKCQIASFIGLITIMFIYFGIPTTFRNPVHYKNGVFCSELIDKIYKSAGILLSPRSIHEAILGPVEILYSSELNFVGFLAQSQDLPKIHRELRKQYL